MTAPNTNIEKQTKRHKGPLIGIMVAVALAVLFAVFFAGADDINEDDAQSGAVTTADG